MEFGIAVYWSGDPQLANREVLIETARRSESLGFDYLVVGDHVVMPVEVAPRYPYSPDGKFSASLRDNILEPLTALAYMGGATSRVRLAVSVLILPYRHPVLMAKMVTTLDHLTGGRVDLGVGVGWMEEEFRALGSPPFADRGRVADEVLQVFKAICTQDEPNFEGKFFRVSGVTVYPKPVQKPHPPIWVGGNSAAALRRVARLGNGWEATALTPEQVAQGKASLEEFCREVGRDPLTVRLSVRLAVRLREGGTSLDRFREDVRRYQEVGVSVVHIRPVAETPQQLYQDLEQLARLREEFA